MQHIPVLLREVIEVIMPKDGGRYFDGTLGGGSHSRAILEESSPSGELACTDLDKKALALAGKNLADFEGRVHPFKANFSEIDKVCLMLNWHDLDGILVDLGVSSIALDDPKRGLSFMHEGPLDMRFSPDAKLTAYEVVNNYTTQHLSNIIKTYGEERFAWRIAGAITKARPVDTTLELADIVSKAIPRKFWPEKIHPATKTFQAIRMEVNGELESLETFLPKAASLLKPGGILAVISFHSLEDRIVKQFFAGPQTAHLLPKGFPEPEVEGPRLEPVKRKPIIATEAEIALNPRSRSAKLRAARRVA